MNSKIITPNYINAFIGGVPYFADKQHPKFALIKAALEDGQWNKAKQLFDAFKKSLLKTGVTVGPAGVLWNGQKIHNVVADRIVEFYRAGKNYKGLAKFLERLLQNPTPFIVEQLYNYMERYKLPIDDDGYIYAIKAVKHNLKSKWTDKVQYVPNKEYRENRAELTANDALCYCGPGLWFGWTEFVFSYGSTGDHVIVVKINPTDVIAVPNSSAYQKAAACAFTPVADLGEISQARQYFELDSNIASNNPTINETIKPRRDARGRFC